MKLTLITAMGLGILGAQLQAADALTLKDQKDKVSYSIGMNIGGGLKSQGLEVNPEVVAAGLKDAFTGGKTLLTEDQVKEILMAFSAELKGKKEAEGKMAGEKNLKEGEAFLAANKKKDGVKVTKSGLQYKVITEGKGKLPKSSDTVKTHYKGTLINGKEFDSSYKRGEPIEFEVGGVIPGWTEALQMMPVGSKWQLFIPADLAYGERQMGPDITPNSTLIFDIELIGIKDGDK